MIITKESKIFQEVLDSIEKMRKDINALKNISFPYKYYMGCDPVGENPPKFKKGDWVIRTQDKDEPNHKKGRIFKILSVYGSQVEECNGITHWSNFLRLATPEEIKKHLIEGALLKGFVGYRRFKWEKSNGNRGNEDITMILPNCGFEYLHDVDALTVGVAESESRRAIYRDGLWATVVYDEPPKNILITESTLYNLVRDFATRFYASDYLDDRDFEVLKFLKSKGYLK